MFLIGRQYSLLNPIKDIFIMMYLRLIPFLIYNSLIWLASSQRMPIDIGNFDKTVHIAEYTILGLLISYGLNLDKDNFESKGKSCVFIGVISGAIDEVHQYFVPTRTMDIIDLWADLTGVSLGIILFILITKYLNKRHKKI